MINFLIHRPIAVIMTFIAILLLGGVALGLLPVSLMPDVDIPEITVQVTRSGVSVNEMENSIVSKLRQNLVQVPHLDDLTSESHEGKATIKLRFDYGADINYAFIDVNEQVDAALRYLPDDMERPVIIKASATDLPVFYINAWLKDSTAGVSKFMEMCDMTESVIIKRLEQLNDVAIVDLTGQLKPELCITPLPEKMQSLGIVNDDISEALAKNNISLGSLEVIDGQYHFNIRFSNALRNVEDVKDIYIRANGRIMQLKDIAEIGIRPKDREGAFLSGKNNALSMAVIKQSDARMEELKTEVDKLVGSFRNDYNEIQFEIVRDQTGLLQYAIHNLVQSLVVGSLLAFVIMFFFLKDTRSPWLIGLSIPVSLVISVLFFKMVGLSINIISLSGLILGVGMMIDNSIIVIDNIAQYMQKGESLSQSCIKGTNEVIRPMISSVLTTCAVFLPLIFLSGISGALFYDQAIAVTVGLFVSLIVSITLLPVLYRLFWLSRKDKEDIKATKTSLWLEKVNLFKAEDIYERGFYWVFRNQKLMLLFFVAALITGVLLAIFLPKKRFPQFKQTELEVKIDWNEKINTQENIRRTGLLVDRCGDEVNLANSYVGSQNFLMHKDMDLSVSEASVYLAFDNNKKLQKTQSQIQQWIEKDYPQANCSFSAPATIFEKLFADSEAPFVTKISATNKTGIPDLDEMESLVQKVNNVYPQVYLPPVSSEKFMEIRVKPEFLALYNVDQQKLYTKLKAAINSFQVDVLRTGSEYIPIVLSDKRDKLEDIFKELKIKNENENKDEISVNALVEFIPVIDYKVLYGGKMGSFVPINFFDLPFSPEKMIPQIRNVVQSFKNVKADFSGSWFSTQKLIRELIIVLLVSLALLYFILAAQFESFTQPLIVLLEVPIDIGGALAVLWVFGGSVNLMSMIGIVVMSGIIINDSILKIDTINHLRKTGMPLMQAIETAGHRRIKSIVMTSLTTILALVPFLWGSDMGSELQRPLALTMIGGMTLGTIVSLYFVPLCYYYIYKKNVPGS